MIKQKIEYKNAYWICGKHSVIECARNNKRKILKIVLSNEQNKKLFSSSLIKKIEIQNNSYFNKIVQQQDVPHQGFALQTIPLSNLVLKEHINNLNNIVALDGVTDPRNIGSIIRSCLAFNIDGIILNSREVDLKSLAMNKAASGSIENIKIFMVSNIINEIKILKNNNFWINGFDSHAQQNIEECSWSKKNVFIFGSESTGIKQLIKKNCDTLLKISINQKIDSLNVSNSVSAALAIYNSKSSKFVNNSGK
jgi:23S rRNA (guanosine2251-2'-O)-methyltransferase